MKSEQWHNRDKFNIIIDGKKTLPSIPFHTADSGLSIRFEFPKHEDGSLQIDPNNTPRYVLVMDINNHYEINSFLNGTHQFESKRYLSMVTETGNINIFLDTPGKHLLVFYLLSDQASIKVIQGFQQQQKIGKFKKVHYEGLFKIINNKFLPFEGSLVGYQEVEIVVPQEALAEVPKSGFEKFFFQWVNEWWSKNPYDECNFAWRAMFMVPFKTLLYELPLFCLRIMVSIFLVFVTQLLKFFFFLFGYNHTNYFYEEIHLLKNTWKRKRYTKLMKGEDNSFESEVSKKKNVYTIFGKEFQVWISPAGLILNIGCVWLLFHQSYFNRGEVFLGIVMPLVIILITLGFMGEHAKAGSLPHTFWHLLGSKDVRDKSWDYDDHRRDKIKVMIGVIGIVYFIHSGYQFVSEMLLLPPSTHAKYEMTDGFLWSSLAFFASAILLTAMRRHIYNFLVYIKFIAVVQKVMGFVKKEVSIYQEKKQQQAILFANEVITAKQEIKKIEIKKEVVKKSQQIKDSDWLKAWNYVNNLIFKKKRHSCKPYAK